MKDNTAQVVAQIPVDVATFLLNEKRSEVLSIEARFKVNLLLVPNRHLETPNFKVERLRHDDLNQSEPLPMSFDMVEAPTQPDVAKEKKEEAKEVRQEAVVKGITPAQPAPVPSAEPAPAPAAAPPAPLAAHPHAGGWFDKVMGWFRHKPAAASGPAVAPAATAQPDRQRRDGRDHRGRGAQQERRDGSQPRRDEGRRGEARHEGRDRRDEGRRGERRDGQPRGQQQAQQQGQRAAAQGPRNDQRRGDGRRGDGRRDEASRGEPAEREQAARQDPGRRDGSRPERAGAAEGAPKSPEKVATEAGTLVAASNTAPEGGEERREGGRRRRRRGRGGGDRQDHGAGKPAATAEAEATHDALTSHDVPAKFVLPAAFEPDAGIPAHATVDDEPVRSQRPESEIESFASAPAPIEPRQEPRVERSIAAAPPAPYVLPADSGLEMVETQHTHAPQPAVAEAEAPRARRVRPPRTVVQDEPLEFVETRKDAPPAP